MKYKVTYKTKGIILSQIVTASNEIEAAKKISKMPYEKILLGVTKWW